MSHKIPAGVNATKDQFDRVFSSTTQERIEEIVEIDYSPIPDEQNPESIRRCIEGAEIVIGTWGSIPYTKDLLDCCPDLKLIVYGAGSFKSYVTPELRDSEITVCTAVHLNARPVAEFTLGIILTSLKNVFYYNDRFKQLGRRTWNQETPNEAGYYHTRIGLLGYGRITEILLKLLTAFDFDVFVADDFADPEEIEALGAKKSDVDAIMQTCDVVSIHHADVEKNWNIINKTTLDMMKPGARLINTSRGRMINEEDLLAKLEEGSITVFLDVTYPEPPREGHPFYTLPNCILTPHVSGSMENEVLRMGDYCLREIENWIARRPLENQIDFRNLEYRA